MQQPAWAPPPQAPRRTGLVLTLILVPVLILTVLVAGLGVYLYRHYTTPSTLPSGLVTAGFRVTYGDGDASGSVRDEVGQLLVSRLGGHARYVVRPHGVQVGVPPAERANLTKLTGQVPLRTNVSLNAVLTADATGASPSAAAGQRLPSLDGKTTYTVGPAALTGTQVSKISSRNDPQYGGWLVEITFNSAGAKRLASFTSEQQGKQLAIVVVGIVVSAPTVQEPITAGAVQISGLHGKAEADGIVAAFRLGQHPVTIRTGDPD